MSHTAETVLARMPRRAPSPGQLASAKIVAHRGQRDGVHVRENTFAAFDPVVTAGVAAIEFDVRYTRDDEPVVVHDADLNRVFGLADVIADTSWKQLSRRAPTLPHLGDLRDRYAGRAHLMIELKTRGSTRGERRLLDHLQGLTPAQDFHVLSLDTTLFAGAAGLDPRCYLPVAKLNLARLQRWALSHECAGLAGPYALLRPGHIRALQRARGFVGSGFVTTAAVLLREIARGVEWVFTNHPLRLQSALAAARAETG
ncbi:glycerophosphodiester phosphodiesterase [Salinisphaera sp. T31B1]|uniref:glycerophosphodiester phosphodiesterase n=1 Tax=Salinisphaera sp. T31B1 TaxID=727963 RepID=UPI0033405751